ncbi:hypothetical protein TWF696_007692 [Orbilia brochopaga]|uniref:Uncharacterized protein n=1 Tax=Orbilia brochopaga TaxID=3140254 RepID=A0AAV9ULU8_9PEZI
MIYAACEPTMQSPDADEGCRHVRKEYVCGGRFWGERLHNCGVHPVGEDCHRQLQIGFVQPMHKKCKSCKAGDTCRRKALQLQANLQVLEHATPRDDMAILQTQIDIEKAWQEAQSWGMMGHIE